MEIVRKHKMAKAKAISIVDNFLEALRQRQFPGRVKIKDVKKQRNGNLITFIYRASEGSEGKRTRIKSSFDFKTKKGPSRSKKINLLLHPSLSLGSPMISGIITVDDSQIRFLFQLSGFATAAVSQNKIAEMFDEFFPAQLF